MVFAIWTHDAVNEKKEKKRVMIAKEWKKNKMNEFSIGGSCQYRGKLYLKK